MIVREATEKEIKDVWRLTYDVYLKEGYCGFRRDGILRHYDLDLIPETTVFVTYPDGILQGTNSLTIDGPKGLHVDHAFKPVVDEIREECYATQRKLAAAWRIVTRLTNRQSLLVVLSLIDATIKKALDVGVLTALFTFNPKHERIYQKLLSLETIAGPVDDNSVKDNPAILMRGDFEKILPTWQRNYGERSKIDFEKYQVLTEQ